MGSWGSPTSVGPIGTAYGVQRDLEAALRRFLHARRPPEPHRNQDSEPTIVHHRYPPSDPKVVPPAYHVEIRSVEVESDETAPRQARRGYEIESGRALRPWPFRWPLPEPDPPRQPPPDALARTGQYIDVLI